MCYHNFEVVKMTGKKLVHELMDKRDLTLKEMAHYFEYVNKKGKRVPIREQSMRNKLVRNSFSFNELEKVAGKLGYDIVLKEKDIEK